jgi:ectoine hydroxylase-related dioxygenase (phytanoyl-CoA dioxygenase family)
MSGKILSQVSDNCIYQPVLVNPGDLVIFDSYVIHKADNNNSNEHREAAFLTYNKYLAGNLHDKYYQIRNEKIKSNQKIINSEGIYY